jgi:8-hydroxy-5-deazaflavin:NADPH oxidoreductase
MGSRAAGNEKAVAWAKTAGSKASEGTFADAAAFGELAFLCTSGEGSVDAATAAGAKNLDGKVLIDISNPLTFEKGKPPSLFTGQGESLGERVQAACPGAKVVKTLNTVISGNDAGAKAKVTELLRSFGWKHVVDLGDLTTARGTEAYLLLWLRLWGTQKTLDFNIHVVR